MNLTLQEQPTQNAHSAPWTKTLSGALAAAIVVALLLYFPDREDGSGAILGGLSSLAGVWIALLANAKVRTLSARSAAQHGSLMVRSFAIGCGVGLANLVINWSMAALDTTIHEQMVTRWAEFSVWSVVVAGPVMEEIAYRLVLLSLLAWVVGRFTEDRRTIFYVALGVSAVIFGIAHIFYGGVGVPVYMVGMALKSSGAGVVFGWIFWRWGLGYAILSHCVANGIHLVLMPWLF